MAFPFLLKELAEEKIILLKPGDASKLPFPLEGVVRLVDLKGKTLGIILDKATLDEIEEEGAEQNPDFLASLEASRKSGRASGKEVKRKTGLK